MSDVGSAADAAKVALQDGDVAGSVYPEKGAVGFVKPLSIVRENLLTQKGYTPYCGTDADCYYSWPRTRFNGKQFQCKCGWQSAYEPEFIAQVVAFNSTPASQERTAPASSSPGTDHQAP